MPAPELSSVSISIRIHEGIALPELCGTARAMHLMLGEPIGAAAAQQAGIVTQVVVAAELPQAVDRLASNLAAIATYRATVGPSHDADEGINAFLEKRAPAWSHR